MNPRGPERAGISSEEIPGGEKGLGDQEVWILEGYRVGWEPREIKRKEGGLPWWHSS